MFDMLTAWIGHGVWGYVVVVAAAATPWVEILYVVPPAVGLGLNPFAVAVLAFAGNYAPVAAIILAYDWTARRRQPRRRPREIGRRRQRAQRLLARYGVAGLSLLGPVVTGIHLATLFALATGASRRSILLWTGVSLLLWTILLTVVSMLGFELVLGGG